MARGECFFISFCWLEMKVANSTISLFIYNRGVSFWFYLCIAWRHRAKRGRKLGYCTYSGKCVCHLGTGSFMFDTLQICQLRTEWDFQKCFALLWHDTSQQILLWCLTWHQIIQEDNQLRGLSEKSETHSSFEVLLFPIIVLLLFTTMLLRMVSPKKMLNVFNMVVGFLCKRTFTCLSTSLFPLGLPSLSVFFFPKCTYREKQAYFRNWFKSHSISAKSLKTVNMEL